ncbi:hypothetical protein Tco_0109567 [Tanacetum coccineum]
MTDSRPVLEQYNELLGILRRFTQHKINMDKSIQVSCIIDKLSLSWKDFKHILKHLNEKLTLVELGSHLGIEESLRVQDSGKPKSNNVVGPSVVITVEHNNSSSLLCDDDVAWWVDSGATVHVCKDRCWFKTYKSLNDESILHIGNESTALVHGRGCVDLRLSIINDNIGSAFMSTSKLNDSILWFCYVYLLHTKDEALDKFKVFITEVELQQWSLSKDSGLIGEGSGVKLWFGVVGIVVRFPDPKLKTLGKRGIECIFGGYAEHSKDFRFFVIEPNESVLINSIIESKDVIFDKNRFSSVPKPSQRSLKDGHMACIVSGVSYVFENLCVFTFTYSNGLKGSILRTP